MVAMIAPVVQAPDGRDGVLECLARHVPVGETADDRARHERERGRDRPVERADHSSSAA